MPDFPIVDSHVHLYDPKQIRYSWMDSQPKLNRLHDMTRYDKDCDKVEVDTIVFVEVGADQWGQHIDEASRIQAIAEREPRLKAIVAAAPLERGSAVEEDLVQLLELDALRSIRRLIQDEKMPGFCTQPDFIEGVQLLGRHGLAFDLCIRHWQMKDAIELVRRCPDVRFVLDHIAKPDIAGQLISPWREDLIELAKFPQVSCKLSGMVTEAEWKAWKPEDFHRYLDCVLEAFGPERVMIGSDWPVCQLSGDYSSTMGIMIDYVQQFSPEIRADILGGNCARIYQL